MVRSYYMGRAASNRTIRPHESALFRAADDESAKVYNIFGGQGNIEEYFDELRELYRTYPSFVGELITSSAELLAKPGSQTPSAEKLYSKGLDIMAWLHDPEATPDVDYLVSGACQFPIDWSGPAGTLHGHLQSPGPHTRAAQRANKWNNWSLAGYRLGRCYRCGGLVGVV